MLAGAVLLATQLLSLEAKAQTVARAAELDLTLRVCREGPAASTARAERGLGAVEAQAIEPLPNPSLVATHQRSLEGPKDRETIVGAEVPLPLSGRRGLLRGAARARQRAAEARADADLFETALDFRAAFELAVLERERASVMQHHQTALESLAAALKQLTTQGEAATYDVRRHQAEARLHARLLVAARVRAALAEKRLSYWLDAPVGEAALATSSLLRAPLSAQPVGTHPQLAALRGMAQASDLEGRAAGRRWIPEPQLFAGYRQVAAGEQVGHGLNVGLTVPLTFFEHGQGAAARARAERALADARAKRLLRQLEVEHAAASTSLQALEAALAQAEQTSAESERLRESARVLYAAGEASITELLDAYRTSESASLDRIGALEELLTARLAVMRAAGKQFDAELDASCGGSHQVTR